MRLIVNKYEPWDPQLVMVEGKLHCAQTGAYHGEYCAHRGVEVTDLIRFPIMFPVPQIKPWDGKNPILKLARRVDVRVPSPRVGKSRPLRKHKWK